MRHHATHRPRALLALTLLTTLLVLHAGRAHAQIDPNWDHYKAYIVAPLMQQFHSVELADQFGTTSNLVRQLEWFANPVEKQHGPAIYPINDPLLHYTWWQLAPQAFSKDVIAINQFGDQELHLSEAQWLLNPALKNAPTGTPLPLANHYKCYFCTGQPVSVPVTLTDQFFSRPALVAVPRYFCTPVEKRLLGGIVYPIVDPKQHYTVYDLGDWTTTIFPATIQDQFIANVQVQLNFDVRLMVPTEKSFPTDAGRSTWGRLKTMYR
jgi:hypothetical protein